MKVSGKLMKKYPERTFQGKNGQMVSRDFAIELTENGYPNYYLFVASGDIVEKLDNFRVGDDIEVSYAINGRKGTGQYEGRIFMNLKCLSIQLGLSQDNSQPETPSGHSTFNDEQYTLPDEEDNDLPF